MFPRALPIFAAVALTSMAACGKATPTADASLQRDLEAARSQAAQMSANMNIAPDEVIPAGNRARVQLPRAEKVRRSPAPTPAPAPAPTPKVVTSAPAAAHDSAIAAAPAMPRPSAQGAISAPPPGGYKTMGELIRKAPFPINP